MSEPARAAQRVLYDVSWSPERGAIEVAASVRWAWQIARWGLLAVPLLLGGGLIAATVVDYFRMRALRALLAPVVAAQPMLDDLGRRSQIGVVASIVVAIVLMSAAVFLWRLRARADQAEALLSRQRHLAALGELSAILAHEIRNPLAAAKGHAQLLVEQLSAASPPDADRSRRSADVVVEHLVRLETLTTQLLDFARTAELDRSDVSPATLLEETAATLDRSRIAVVTDAAPSAWRLDRVRMAMVLANLLRNALEASPDDAQVTATARADGSCLVFEVRDRGAGIPVAVRDRLFEPFHTTRVRGTGLGLAVAQRIVQQHEGRIEATNHPEGGALFRVTLPEG